MYFRLMGKLNARRNNLLKEDEKGFTLIELLVVVIIIGILAAIAIPVYIGVQNNAKDNAAKSDLTTAKTAVVAYQTQDAANAFPADLAAAKTADGWPSGNDTLNYAPTESGFCIDVTSASSSAKKFHVTEATSVEDGGC